MALTFNSEGMAADVPTRVAQWQAAREAAPTAEAFATTYLGAAGDDIKASVQNGRLVLETADSAKNRLPADGQPPLAYFRLEVNLDSRTLADLAEVLTGYARAWGRMLE